LCNSCHQISAAVGLVKGVAKEALYQKSHKASALDESFMMLSTADVRVCRAFHRRNPT
jgi:hypothetical protein